jgi:hypothetical protein
LAVCAGWCNPWWFEKILHSGRRLLRPSIGCVSVCYSRESILSAVEAVIDNQPIGEEDSLRADMYDFLASLLRAEPSDELIEKVAQLQGDGTAIGSACLTLAHLAKSIDNGLIRNEYVEMFIRCWAR